MADKIKGWNRKKEKFLTNDPKTMLPETQEEIDEINKFIQNHQFYTFHGEHRRAAVLKLHEVRLKYYYNFLLYNYINFLIDF